MELNKSEILARLLCVTKLDNNKYIARCPAHDDKTPSLSLTFTDSRALMHCHAGCTFKEVKSALTGSDPDYHMARQVIRSEAVPPRSSVTDPIDCWEAAKAPNENHPYLTKKRIPPLGKIRQRWNTLLVPLYNADDELFSVQYINAEGIKKFHMGRPVKELYTVVGELNAQEVYLCEGYATGVSLHQMVDTPVVCSMTASNLEPVAAMLKQRGKSVIIAADNDHRSSQNAGLSAATRAAERLDTGLITFQPCGNTCRCTDFNDVLNCPDWLGEVAR